MAESRLRQKALVGNVSTGRAGLGYFPKTLVSQARGKEIHHLLQEEVRAGVEEERVSRSMGLWQQGAWTRWESTLQRRITWANILQADFHRVRFLVQAVYDTLPSPANLHVWGKSETPSCLLCSGRGSLEHLLSSCPKALADGRYRWRHDQVLKTIAESLDSAISTSKYHHVSKKAISFIKAGEKLRARPHLTTGLLTRASDWQLQVDLGKQLRFPQHIATTSLRPDMIVTSEVVTSAKLRSISSPGWVWPQYFVHITRYVFSCQKLSEVSPCMAYPTLDGGKLYVPTCVLHCLEKGNAGIGWRSYTFQR